MKKFLTCSFLLSTVLTMASCANSAKVATYEYDGKTEAVTVGDIREYVVDNYPSYEYYYYGINWLTYMALYDSTLASDTVTLEGFASQIMGADLMYYYAVDNGMLEDPEFLETAESYKNSSKYTALYSVGFTGISNEIANTDFETARASHILIMPETYGSDDDGNFYTLEGEELDAAWEDARIKAQNVLDSLLASDNLKEDFEQAVLDYSEDYGSVEDLGDVGYIYPGQMVPEFEAAVFEPTKKGLYPEVVETTYGYHIIYVSDPMKKVSLAKYEALLDEDASDSTAMTVFNALYSDYQNDNLVENYTLNEDDETVTIGSDTYPIATIPDSAAFYSFFGEDYTWGEYETLLSAFDVEISNATSFSATEYNFLYPAFMIKYAEINGLEKSKEYEESLSENTDSINESLAYEFLESYLTEMAESEMAGLSDEDYEEFFDYEVATGSLAVYDEDYNLLEDPTFEEAFDTVTNDYMTAIMSDYYFLWQENVEETYNVEYLDKGVATLSDALTKDIDDYLNSEEGQTYSEMMMQQMYMGY